MYLIKTPDIIQRLFSNYTWCKPENEKVVYFTFDDGPIPDVTEWVLDQLDVFDAKGTFFCVGENVVKYPSIYQRILAEGHSVGNHTFNHLNGWNEDYLTYLRNIKKCSQVVDSKLFRPPYGRLKPKQALYLQRYYKIIMWEILSGDFDPKISPQKCYENIVNNVKSGSIVVLHDSLKSEKNLRYALPKALSTLKAKGYSFKAIQEQKVEVLV